jgi:hypothetical protein
VSLISSIIGYSQTSKAVNAEVGAGNTALGNIQGAATAGNNVISTALGESNNILGATNSTEQQNLNPYQQLGTSGTAAVQGALNNPFAFNPNTIASNPDYQFQLQQGTQAVQRAAAANGTLSSGGTAKAIDQFSQGLASNEIGQAYNQALSTYQTNLGAGQSAVNTGLQGTGLSQAAYQNYGNLASQNTTNEATQAANIGINAANAQTPVLEGIGNAQAAGSIKQGNIWGGFVNNVSNDAAAALAA